MKKILNSLIFYFILLLPLFVSNQTFAYNSEPKILIVYSNSDQRNLLKNFRNTYQKALLKYSKAKIFYEEFYLTNTQKEKQLKLTAKLYEMKYPDIDLIIAIGNNALKVLENYKSLSNRKFPLIYIGKIGKESPFLRGKTFYYPFYLQNIQQELIKSIFYIQPKIDEILLIHDNYFQKWDKILSYKNREKLPLKNLSKLTKNATMILIDPIKQIDINPKLKHKIFKNRPIYTIQLFDFTYSSYEFTGGLFFDIQKCSKEIAKLSIRILDGEKPKELVSSEAFYYFALTKSALRKFDLKIKNDLQNLKLITDNKTFISQNKVLIRVINYLAALIIITSILYFFYFKGKDKQIKNESDAIAFYIKTLNALAIPAFYAKKGVIKAVNQSLLSIINESEKQIIGKKFKKASFYTSNRDNSSTHPFKQYVISFKSTTYIYELHEKKLSALNGSENELIVSFIDITEKEKLKKELHKKNQSLQLTYEQSQEGIIEWDLNLNKVNFSKGFYTLYKYSPQEIPGNIDQFISNFVHEEDRENFKKLLFKMQSNQIKSLECSLRILRKDNKYRDSLLKAESVVQNNKGENIFVLGMIIDIHEQKEFEENLKNSEANLSAVIDNSPRSIILLDQNLRIVLFNAMAQARMILLMGKSMQKEHEFLEYFNEDPNKETLNKVLLEGLDGNFISFERELQDAQNNPAYFEFYIFPVVNKREHIQGVCVTIDDISYRKLSERKISESEEKYRLLFKNMSSGFSYLKVISNPDNENPDQSVRLILSETNPALEEITGLSENHLIGEEFENIFPQLPIHQKIWKDFFLNQNPLLNKLSIKEYYSEKYQRWFSFAFFKAKSGYLAAIIRDITQGKEDEVKITTALSQKEMLLREIHHRVKNNLQIIYGLFLMRGEKLQDDNIKSILKECRNQIQSMALVHTKLYENENIDKVNLKSYIEDLSTSLGYSYALERRNIIIISDIDEIMVNIDTAIPCGLLLNEALTNGIKHAFSENESGKIELKIKKHENEINFSIQDNGKGLPKDFDLEKQKNISLGMDLIRMLTEQLRGELSISSKNGTKISLSFQLKEKDLR